MSAGICGECGCGIGIDDDCGAPSGCCICQECAHDCYHMLVGQVAKLLAERDEARDCGQSVVCKIPPGCQRHWEERNRELVSERDEARAMVLRMHECCGCNDKEVQAKRKEWGVPVV